MSSCILGSSAAAKANCIRSYGEAEDSHFPPTLASQWGPTWPSRSAACRPAALHTRTALHALPSLLNSPVTVRVLSAKKLRDHCDTAAVRLRNKREP